MADTETSTGTGYYSTVEDEIDDRWSLGYAVREDGTTWPILIDGEAEGEQQIPTAYGWREVAPHEGNGAVPSAYRVIRCAATTGKGAQCKFRPRDGMPYCGTHEDRDGLLVALRTAECVSALKRLYVEHVESMRRWPAYVAAYKSRGRYLTAEGAIW